MSKPKQAPPDWLGAGLPHVWLPYTQMKGAPEPVAVVATRGARLVLSDGRELIDGTASWWTACHGYNHPHIRSALEHQAAVMPHVMFGGLAHEPGFTLAKRLAALLPGSLNRVFFSESGSVSVEIGLKMALQYWLNRGEQGRTKFLSFRGGYHGDTFGAMSVCDPEEGMHARMSGFLPAQHVVELPRDEASLREFERFLDSTARECAALIVEPLIQAAGGMRFHEPSVLARLASLARTRGLLVIFDEIFTGFGRTGTLFACEQAAFVPDVITLSKALTGGTLPLAVTVASDAVFDAFWSDSPGAALMHGPTFMANPLACAAAHASLDLFEREPRLEQVASIGAQLASELEVCRGLPGVVDVRVRGAVGVVELDHLDSPERLRSRLVQEGVWVRPFANVVCLSPPLVISEPELARLTGAVAKVLEQRSAV